MMTDPIADMLTRIRNAHLALHKEVSVPSSKMKEAIAAILKQEGYVDDVTVEDRNINIQLKYFKGKPAIEGGCSMSRIGKLPIAIPSGVEVKVGADVVEVKGAKAALTTPVCDLLSYEVADGHITLTRKAETRESRAQHGLRRTLLANCIEGVTKGFSKTLEVIGVGYRVAVKGNVIELQVGFSHPVLVELPAGLSAKVEGQKLTIMGADKVLVGEMAARIRRIRKPEPYKGKGIKYETETILRKAGKSGGKGK